jgi:tetratricopeptide (TPR) repeat protein
MLTDELEINEVQLVNHKGQKGIKIGKFFQSEFKFFLQKNKETCMKTETIILSLAEAINVYLPFITDDTYNWNYSRDIFFQAEEVLKQIKSETFFNKTIISRKDVIQILNKLGRNDLYVNCNYKKAKLYFEEEYEIHQTIYEKTNTRANCLDCLGIVHDKLGEFALSLNYYKNACDIRKHIYGDKDSPELALSLNNLGISYEILGNFKNYFSK